MFDVAIIGLGATGVSLLSQMQDQVYKVRSTKPQIAVFNPACSFAKGKAFGDAHAVHKVNTPPNMMALTTTEPEQFGHWLYSAFSTRERWPSRLKYSDFISQTYLDIRKAGILQIEEWRHSVRNLCRTTNGFLLTDDNGDVIHARQVVMCLGSLAAEMYPEFTSRQGFITHYTQFDPHVDKPLLIAGSGLTAIDALRYARSKSRAEIHLYSRSGYAPTCLTERNAYAPVHLTWRNIMAASAGSDDVLNVFSRLLRKEFYLLRERGEFRPAMKLLRTGRQTEYLSFLLARAEKGDLPWQDVLVSTRPYMHKLWNAFSLDQKKRFMKMYGAVWAAWRHPVPQEVYSELLQASTEGKLRFHQAMSSPEHDGNLFHLKTRSHTLSASQLWDATGGRLQLDAIQQPLLQNLLSQQLIESHPCGGINIDPLTFQCRVENHNVTGLYNIGPLSKGCLFSTNAFWFNAQCAENWAKKWAIDFSENRVKETL